MENTLALILNLVLAIICIWHIIASYLAKDKTKLWSPITFLSLTYLYYCVIPMFETDGFLNGISSAPYVSLFHVAALLSFVSILFGFQFGNLLVFGFGAHVEVGDNGGDDENCGHEGDRTGEDKGEVSGVTDGVMYNHRIEERNEEHFDDHPREIL